MAANARIVLLLLNGLEIKSVNKRLTCCLEATFGWRAFSPLALQHTRDDDDDDDDDNDDNDDENRA
eukprot:CAMPEP_0119352010 /NCGR_PEP_ID=MMETSP1334-20130426/1297_1 /TAXON_ID=127549 /ORGANISM="Calcidiscus leptoporus, Strain RCC1130" /LENGTH=65 /DNA_ID=CAMNT_0007364941 /DNA_START=34 /DNA_END=227 /DNA_ORIENTATION=-